ncbi:MAG: response regulator transcription factor [Stenotrophomonas sp.]|uniref:response regulator transcription factor n=1 Tax=Stenotrophomonas sp. TaxID=69392 RepID=UPI003D6D92AC
MVASLRDSPYILVLEDDVEMREEVVMPGLRDYGFAVAGVGTAAGLYEALKTRTPEVVILDVGLPDADGFSVAQAVRALLPSIGVVMLTGHGAVDEQVRGLSQGADAYLVKPVQIELLAVCIHSLLRRLHGPIAPLAMNRWHFDPEGWCVVSPQRRTVALTKSEQRMMVRLAGSLGRLVTREQLAAAMTDNIDDFDLHRIESLVHRLRRKVLDQIGERLPLVAVHGKGYVLDDHCRAEAPLGALTAVQ